MNFYLKSFLIVSLDVGILLSLWCFFDIPSISVPEQITPIILTWLGTILAFLSGHYLYDDYNKPFLELVELNRLGDYWRVKITNNGRSGAENSCGDVRMIGKLPNMTLKIEGRISWARILNPEASTINAGDSQFLNLLRLNRDNRGNLVSVEFPTEEGYNVPRPILRKHTGHWIGHRNRVLPNELQIGEWENLVIITSSNAESKRRRFLWEIDRNDLTLEFNDC